MIEVSDLDWLTAEELFCVHGEPAELAKLLRSDKPIPPRQRNFLAALVMGAVKPPSKRGRANARLTRLQREDIYVVLEGLRREHRRAIRDAKSPESNREIGDVKSQNAAQVELVATYLAKKYGVATSTILKTHQRFKL